MKIYMAGIFSGRGTDTSQSVNFKASQTSAPKYVLESYHYMKGPMVKQIRKDKRTIFLDSGAFSMFTQGVTVNLKTYAQFISEHQDMIHIASNLDVIGRGNEEGSYNNQKELESYGVKIQPVHHARDKDDWLLRYMDEGYDYIFLGGMVPESKPYLLEWLDHVWGKFLVNADGSPKVKVHGFGLTTLDLMLRYPWYSVDSTSWVMTSRFGSVFLDFPDGKVVKVDFSSQSSKMRDANSWHYNNLRPDERAIVDRRLAELDAGRHKDPEMDAMLEKALGFKQGYNPQALGEMYGWRDHMNIDFFNRLCSDKPAFFKQEQPKLFT